MLKSDQLMIMSALSSAHVVQWWNTTDLLILRDWAFYCYGLLTKSIKYTHHRSFELTFPSGPFGGSGRGSPCCEDTVGR